LQIYADLTILIFAPPPLPAVPFLHPFTPFPLFPRKINCAVKIDPV